MVEKDEGTSVAEPDETEPPPKDAAPPPNDANRMVEKDEGTSVAEPDETEPPPKDKPPPPNDANGAREQNGDNGPSLSRRQWAWIWVLFGFASILGIIAIWGVIEGVDILNQDPGFRPKFEILWVLEGNLGEDGLIVVLALAAGVVGSLIHYVTSLTYFAGNRTFKTRWVIWYLARPLLGGFLAVILYLVIRAGLLPGAGGTEAVSAYGVAAFAGLAGLFSAQAIEWLQRVFDSATGKREEQNDPVKPNDPVIQSVSYLEEDSSEYLMVIGKNFGDSGAIVQVAGDPRDAQHLNDTTLRVPLRASDRQTTPPLPIMVVREDGETSNEVGSTLPPKNPAGPPDA